MVFILVQFYLKNLRVVLVNCWFRVCLCEIWEWFAWSYFNILICFELFWWTKSWFHIGNPFEHFYIFRNNSAIILFMFWSYYRNWRVKLFHHNWFYFIKVGALCRNVSFVYFAVWLCEFILLWQFIDALCDFRLM